jgi:SAM-dependent methyltransferase
VRKEVNLLKNYPKTNRQVDDRDSEKKGEYQEIARRFDKEFFDGSRKTGYGGYYYSPRFWRPVIPTISDFYSLTSSSRVLDVGCGKGFFLFDLVSAIPGIGAEGIDISEYAVSNALPSVKPHMKVGNAKRLPYADSTFDLVISINTIHNLELADLIRSLHEIERVSRGNAFLTVDAYRTESEKEKILKWNLTAKTIRHVDEWQEIFIEAGYTGDYYWFFP